MDSATLEPINYVSKISKKKLTADSISNYLCNIGAHNIDKPCFMDELRSLKQEASVTKERDYNQDETTALKNRMKLLELKSQLLKDDVSNKQKFIDKILKHNSKLSHNPATPTTYVHHVTREPQHIRENQNGERSDTEHNDDGNVIINRIGKITMITTTKKRNPNKINYQQT